MRILFLCTGNSCRSQMAEGFARALAADHVEVHSAGTAPEGVNPLAARVMAEAGASIEGQRSKALADVPSRFDLVVTLCGDAAETCPSFPGAASEHWPLPDPAAARGAEDDVLARFREVRDDIRVRVDRLLRQRDAARPGAGPGAEVLPGDRAP